VTNACREALACGNYSYFGSLSTADVSRGCFTAFELLIAFPSRFFFTAVQDGRPLYLGKIERTKTGQYNRLSQNSHHNTFVPTPLHMYMVMFLSADCAIAGKYIPAWFFSTRNFIPPSLVQP
jgi:hypothetical protein